MNATAPRPNHPWLEAVLIAAVLVLTALCLLLILQIRGVLQTPAVRDYRRQLPPLHTISGTTPADVSYIQAWMTFDYIDRVFGMPSRYLKSALSISDARYPSLSVTQWARGAGTTTAAGVRDVQDAVESYLAARP